MEQNKYEDGVYADKILNQNVIEDFKNYDISKRDLERVLSNVKFFGKDYHCIQTEKEANLKTLKLHFCNNSAVFGPTPVKDVHISISILFCDFCTLSVSFLSSDSDFVHSLFIILTRSNKSSISELNGES